jgi:hypothetical protein
LSAQHCINCRREKSQISEPRDATIREKAPNPFHLIRREAVSFANLKTFVPGSPFGRSLFGHGFSLRVLFLPIARGIEAVQCGDSPSRASFGKVGSIMKRLRVPIDRHADGQLTKVLRKIVLVVTYRRQRCSRVPTVIE